jgi:hypothetical protein
MPRPAAPEGLIAATLRGGSMRPWLPPGTDVLIRPAEGATGACRAGDVLVVRLGEAWAAHRAVRGSRPPAMPATRGDWTGRPDPPAAPGSLVGRVAFAKIGGRWRSLEGRASRAAGLATVAIVGVLTRLGARGLVAEARTRGARRGAPGRRR